MERRIADLVESGPLTGAELHQALGGEAFALWKAARLSPRLQARVVGRRYLRIDPSVEGSARLSPSVLREFLTYTVVGRAGDPVVEGRAAALEAHVRAVSHRKRALAARIMADVAGRFPSGGFCVLLAGDIVYGMAHDVDRPERSTGTMVHGSDLDIVVVVADEAPDSLATGLTEAIHQQKFLYLRNPAFREEVDYVVKRFGRLREQAAFDTVQRMVACKIYDEAVLLLGEEGLHQAGRDLLEAQGVIERLRAMERLAVEARTEHEAGLLAAVGLPAGRQSILGLYTDDEAEELT